MYIPAKVHGEAALDGDRHGISKGNMVVIPPGTEHDAINTSITEPLRLYIFYSPPDSASSPVTVREHGPRAPSPTGRSGVRSLPTRVKIVSKDDAAMQDHRKHDAEHLAMAAGHGGHGGGKTSGGHAGHDEHAGHATSTFRDRFWVSLVLSVPVVLYSEMVQMWFGFSMPRFAGSAWVAPVLGTFIFLWGGWPFLKGGFQEVRQWRPGMMLLISMAITVAFVASAATTLGLLDLDFWWELALLVRVAGAPPGPGRGEAALWRGGEQSRGRIEYEFEAAPGIREAFARTVAELRFGRGGCSLARGEGMARG